MAIIQPNSWYWDKQNAKTDRTGTEFSSKKYDDILGGELNTTVSYPSNTNSLTNMMAIYFNSLEGIDIFDLNPTSSISNTNSPNRNYMSLTGYTEKEAPLKNTAFQSLIQESNINAIVNGIGDLANKIPLLGGAGDDFKKKVEQTKKKYMRTGNMIWLMLPQTIRFGDSANWDELNFDPNALGLLGTVMAQDEGKVNAVKSMTEREIFGAVSNLTGQGDIGSALAKSIQNTYNDMNFKSMQRRQFQFLWTFVPKSQEDLQNVYDIIKLMRFHAHPSISDVGGTTGTYLNYPGQIDIEWYTKDTQNGEYVENAWIPKISHCVITSIETDLSPNNQYSFFKNSGAPTQINLQLSLTEVAPLLKTDIARGF